MKKYTLLLLFMIASYSLGHGQSVKSSGTGFFVSENGIIVTCAHVLEDGTRIMVKIANNEYPVQVLAKNISTDLAILKTWEVKSSQIITVKSR